LVACGAASHLRLKLPLCRGIVNSTIGRMWSGFSSEIETDVDGSLYRGFHLVACGAASHLRLKHVDVPVSIIPPRASHVERLLI